MILKTEGIVLRTLKHQDANLITTVYTLEYGIKSFFVQGFRSVRSRKKHSYFQPISVVELVFFQRENRDLQKITETKSAVMLQQIQTHPIKLSLGLAIIEIFYDTVKEESPNPQLYGFLRNTIVEIDRSETRLIQLFIYFVLHMSRFLGFFPNDKSKGSKYVHFDLKNGVFEATAHQKEPVSHLLRRFLHADFISCRDITFDNDEKRNLITTLFGYYQHHIQGFRYPQTLKVFAEVFG